MDYPKKLIEVALPLDDINTACSREKSIRHGHPSTLHLWWARRPLAAARAVLFAQLVNDPGGRRGYQAYKGQTKEDAQRERERLFQIIRDLVKWENTNNEELLERAREEIRKSWQETCEITGENPEKMPPFLDPFAGGGTIPLEAQRLGLEPNASDLNPVAVMINKAMIEIPPKFAGRKPVGPKPSGPEQKRFQGDEDWSGTNGMAEDVRRYGMWLKEEAFKRIGHLYPKVDLPNEHGGRKAVVIAWLWARTVMCPNPACGCKMPLVRSFDLSTKKKKIIFVEPSTTNASNPSQVKFNVKTGNSNRPNGTVNRKGAHCICCNTAVPFPYIRSEGKAGRLSTQLMAIVAEGKKGRVYISPSEDAEKVAHNIEPQNMPETDLPEKALGFRVQEYGMIKHKHLFTHRQLEAATTFSDLVVEARGKIIADTKAAGWADDGKGINDGGTGGTAYGDALTVYLAFALDKMCDYNSSLSSWGNGRETIRNTFARHALPMVWDFAEINPFSDSTGNYLSGISQVVRVIKKFSITSEGIARQQDVNSMPKFNSIISTDPPYYDNIGYADLSDFFYVWLRRSLKSIFQDIFSTMLVPKGAELVATRHRHGNKENAEKFFLEGITKAIHNMANNSHQAFPVTIYYAFKQSETKESGTVSTGWESFLQAVIKANFSITGTWPMRTELGNRMVSMGTNALASSIILVCRKRSQNAKTISRKQFLRELEESLPESLEDMIGAKEGASPIAPVDLAQAAIGPGMSVFSQYAAVLEADGSPMTVHTALILINKSIDEYFSQAESDMGADTRFCVDWFQQYGFKQGPFGEADVLARAKGTTVDGVEMAGVIESGGGKVRLLRVNEYLSDWDPNTDKRIPIWEACHQLCRALKGSETEAGALLSKMLEKTESIRQLAYRLYTLCERKGWAEDAMNYNELITSWHAIVEASHEVGKPGQQSLFEA